MLSTHELFSLYLELEKINIKLTKIMAKQSEMATEMVALTAQVKKIGEESTKTLAVVDELQKVIDGLDNVTPELQAAFDALKVQVTVVDDLIPDAPTPTA